MSTQESTVKLSVVTPPVEGKQGDSGVPAVVDPSLSFLHPRGLFLFHGNVHTSGTTNIRPSISCADE
ncbi:hypothetical protein M404DRAFT_389174 [Pisolithus tinctorius Marx 270]|uniref:Uncharacterized protein n=1 Tax=Pisolithus tinctorius Marx 270 TaxID=870435 RepID=A0A0C3KD91_PISTI|nr:hypothetical protein M404DRAFT_389174 [Pisolithus tinctorius Marx 270]